MYMALIGVENGKSGKLAVQVEQGLEVCSCNYTFNGTPRIGQSM